jgi:hypothetical protein
LDAVIAIGERHLEVRDARQPRGSRMAQAIDAPVGKLEILVSEPVDNERARVVARQRRISLALGDGLLRNAHQQRDAIPQSRGGGVKRAEDSVVAVDGCDVVSRQKAGFRPGGHARSSSGIIRTP